VREEPLPPVAAVISFIDAINRGDMDALAELMAEEHHLDVFDEEPLVGRGERRVPGGRTRRTSRAT